MKVCYIAHPISGDIKGNLERIVQIGRQINLTEPDVVPFAHYYFDCHSMDDDIPKERERGIKNDTELFKRGFIDELRLYGNRISTGMKAEISLCLALGIQVTPMTEETKKQLMEMFGLDTIEKKTNLSLVLNFICARSMGIWGMQITLDMMKSRWRKRQVCEARQIFCRYARINTKQTFATIGMYINKNYTTVLHGIKNIESIYDLQVKYAKIFNEPLPEKPALRVSHHQKAMLLGIEPQERKPEFKNSFASVPAYDNAYHGYNR